jgi:ribose transport system substrate-binding protein
MRSIVKGFALIVMALAILLLVSAAGGQAQTQKFTFGLSLSTLNNPFFVSVRDGAQAAATQLGVDLIVVDSQDALDKQVANIQDLITKKVNALLVNATDSSGVAPVVKQANAVGIPVFAIDRAIDVSTGAQVAGQIASDNVYGGKLQADYLNQLLNGKGNVVELEGIPGASAAIDRKAGFEKELAVVAPNIKIIADQPAGFALDQGVTVMQNILQANPGKIDAVVAANDQMALGALKAIQQAGAKSSSGGRIFIIGFDAIDDALAAIKAGNMDGTIQQQPSLMGQLGVQAAYLVATDPLFFSKLPSGQFFPVPVKLVTAANM